MDGEARAEAALKATCTRPFTAHEIAAENQLEERQVQAVLHRLQQTSTVRRKWLKRPSTNVYWTTHTTLRSHKPAPAKQPQGQQQQQQVPAARQFKTPQRSRRLAKPFSTPRQSTGKPAGASSQKDSLLSVSQEITALSSKVDQLSQEYRTEELDTHIDKLHTYNDLKDVAQAVMGMLASQEGIATRDMYSKYDLSFSD